MKTLIGSKSRLLSGVAFLFAILSINETYSYTFSTEGTYQYHSRINPDMTGKVVVN
jgi:hypothetical protein